MLKNVQRKMDQRECFRNIQTITIKVTKKKGQKDLKLFFKALEMHRMSSAKTQRQTEKNNGGIS